MWDVMALNIFERGVASMAEWHRHAYEREGPASGCMVWIGLLSMINVRLEAGLQRS